MEIPKPIKNVCIKNIMNRFDKTEAEAEEIVDKIHETEGDEPIKQIHARNYKAVEKYLTGTKKKTPAKKKSKAQRVIEENSDILDHMTDAERVESIDVLTELTTEYLPQSIIGDIETIIDAFCSKYDIKAPEQMGGRWAACCILIGQHIRRNKYLLDKPYMDIHGGKKYRGEALEELLAVFDYFCNSVKCAPLVHDFVSFSGIPRNTFYDYERRQVTPALVQIVQKAQALQERGLINNMTNGGKNPVGSIFLLKSLYGYRESSEIIHTTTETRRTAGEIAASMGLIEDNSENPQ